MLPQIKSLKPRHDAIMEWLVANPDKRLGDCARAFAVSQPWLSCIIHSDIFQARYQKMLGDYRDERILPLRDKIVGIAHSALDKLADQLPAITDTEQVLDIANGMLKAAGFGSKVSVNVPPGGMLAVSAVTPEDLARARERYRASQRFVQEGNLAAIEHVEPSGGG